MFPSSLKTEPLTLQIVSRDVKKVPFVELFDDRLQGVVSSGSDIERVYVSYFEAKTLEYYCSTNNNRPCGGCLQGRTCSHLSSLVYEAVKQYGLVAVVKYMQLDPDTIKAEYDMLNQASHMVRVPVGSVFSRFLSYLQLVEHPLNQHPLPELAWF